MAINSACLTHNSITRCQIAASQRAAAAEAAAAVYLLHAPCCPPRAIIRFLAVQTISIYRRSSRGDGAYREAEGENEGKREEEREGERLGARGAKPARVATMVAPQRSSLCTTAPGPVCTRLCVGRADLIVIALHYIFLLCLKVVSLLAIYNMQCWTIFMQK